MTKHAFMYAMEQVRVPEGRRLWLYGPPALASGEVYQPWHAEAQWLRRQGCAVVSDVAEIGQGYDAVLVDCSKQMEETRGLIALALARSKGFVMAAAANDAGGGRLARMMQAYGVEVQHCVKDKCRVAWTLDGARADKALIAQNLGFLAVREVEMGGQRWWTQPGLFGWDKIDPGSALLLEHVPQDVAGRVADFGCGYGYLSAMVLRRCDGIASIDAYDADARAVACCTRNNGQKVRAIWQDVTMLEMRGAYDAVVMNPPFHSGKAQDIALGSLFIRKAWESLKPGGRLFMVANRHLEYESIVPELGIVVQKNGYKIMAGRKA